MASFKIIAVIYGGKWRSWLKRERVFKMRETMAESGARGRSRVSRDLDRVAPVFFAGLPFPCCNVQCCKNAVTTSYKLLKVPTASPHQCHCRFETAGLSNPSARKIDTPESLSYPLFITYARTRLRNLWERRYKYERL